MLTVGIVASNFGLDLPEIEDEGESDEEDEEIHSSRGMNSHYCLSLTNFSLFHTVTAKLVRFRGFLAR
jgi:hypothetical protein